MGQRHEALRETMVTKQPARLFFLKGQKLSKVKLLLNQHESKKIAHNSELLSNHEPKNRGF
jgi:hypothetical protein